MEECQKRIFNMVQEAKKKADLPSDITLAALVSKKILIFVLINLH